MAGGEEPPEVVVPSHGVLRLLDGRAEAVVGVDDEHGQQGVAVGDVAVDGRGDHAEIAGHGAQGEGGRAVPGQMLACGVEDLCGDLDAGSLAGGARASVVVGMDPFCPISRAVATKQSSALDIEDQGR